MAVMVNDATDLACLTRDDLLALAKDVLTRQASVLYDPSMAPELERIFAHTTEFMDDDQLRHVIRRGVV